MKEQAYTNADAIMFSHQEQFLAYVYALQATQNAEHIKEALQLKQAHSLRVVGYAEKISMHSYGAEVYLPSILGALWHDIGRFEQFIQYETFKDAESCNHGKLGLSLIKRYGFLRTEIVGLQKKVQAIVLLHNTFMLPQGLPTVVATPLSIVRDSDRVDIFYTIAMSLASSDTKIRDAVALYAKDVPDRYSANVLQALQKKDMVLYTDIRFHNDIRLMLFSWIYHFSSAYARTLVSFSCIEDLYAGLPKTMEILHVYEELQEFLCR